MTSFMEFMTSALPYQPHVLLVMENTFLRKYKKMKEYKKKLKGALVFFSQTSYV